MPRVVEIKKGSLKLVESTGTYTYAAIIGSEIGIESPYTRTIKVISPNDPDELEIESTVSWTSGGRDFSITNHEYLYSWMMAYTP